MKIYNKSELKEKRRELRNKGTYAEANLWNYLKHSRLEGRKFRRQISVYNFIVDFYCSAEKLAIELDGEPHFTQEGKEYDVSRTAAIEKLGIKVLRFENQEVELNIDNVLAEIKNHFKNT